jgi:hypothetical protein
MNDRGYPEPEDLLQVTHYVRYILTALTTAQLSLADFLPYSRSGRIETIPPDGPLSIVN